MMMGIPEVALAFGMSFAISSQTILGESCPLPRKAGSGVNDAAVDVIMSVKYARQTSGCPGMREYVRITGAPTRRNANGNSSG